MTHFIHRHDPSLKIQKHDMNGGAECFSHDGKFITYSSNESNPMNMFAFVRDLVNDEDFCIADKPGWYIPGYWSPDSEKINCSQLVMLTDYTILNLIP